MQLEALAWAIEQFSSHVGDIAQATQPMWQPGMVEDIVVVGDTREPRAMRSTDAGERTLEAGMTATGIACR